jgi:co-chaperonin GroES (HSP10)
MSVKEVAVSPADETISLCMREIGCEPEVLGWDVLIKAVEVPEKIGSVYLPDASKDSQQRRQNIGLVLAIGPVAFTDRFESRKCNVGDYIHYSILDREPVYANDHACFYIEDHRCRGKLKPEEVHMFLNSKK